jgi:hypothetical protein
MRGVIERLLEGDTTVVQFFAEAKTFWSEFFELHKNDNDAELAKAISNAQPRHEMIFGGDRCLGKVCMPYTAIGTLYDTGKGFEDNRGLAARVVVAFMSSHVSLEVKSAARDAARLYNLTDEPEVEEAIGSY